jgi:hypothetical protein
MKREAPRPPFVTMASGRHRKDEVAPRELNGRRVGRAWRGDRMDSAASRTALHESFKHKRFSAPLAIMFQSSGERRSRHRPAMGIQNKLHQLPAGSKRPYSRCPGRSALTHNPFLLSYCNCFYDTVRSVTDNALRIYDLGQFFAEILYSLSPVGPDRKNLQRERH